MIMLMVNDVVLIIGKERMVYMKIKIFRFLCVVVGLALLSGCTSGGTGTSTTYDELYNIEFSPISIYDMDGEYIKANKTYIITDDLTGVEYILVYFPQNSGSSVAITPRYNSDGSIRTSSDE